LEDLFTERENYLAQFCAEEYTFLVLWTRLNSLTPEQRKRAQKERDRVNKAEKIPNFRYTQNLILAIPDLRENHDAFVRSIVGDLNQMNIVCKLLEVHEAVRAMRFSADPEFTDLEWRPSLPGDPLTIRETKEEQTEVSDIMWPSLARQLIPRDAENLDLRTVRIGDRIYSNIFIDLFPQDIQTFVRLFSRTLQARIPWRISFFMDSNGLGFSSIREFLASVLSFTSGQNRLINGSLKLLSYINLSTDDAVVRLRVVASTWAPEGEKRLLRSRTSVLAKAIEGWGSCQVSEICGDAFQGAVSSM